MLARCLFTFTTWALKVSGEIEVECAPIRAKLVFKKMLSYCNSVPKALRLSLMLPLPFHRDFLKESWITMPESLNNGFTRLVSLVQLTINELYPCKHSSPSVIL